jgi:acyl-CoA thioesterase-2
MERELQDLIDLLDLENIETNIFRGVSPEEGWRQVYGGQVLAQALVAASRTVEDPSRIAHSLHGYFLRPGDPSIPILYNVDRIRDGKSFTTRRVVAIQKGRAIFNMAVSLQISEEGFEHQMPMPKVTAPEQCVSSTELREQYREDVPEEFLKEHEHPGPIEMRFVEPINDFKPDPMPPYQHVWMRTIDKMPQDLRLSQCLLAYASDMTLLDTSCRPHGIGWATPNFQTASLDHAMWFHHPAQVDEWLLHAQDSPSAEGARGFNRATIFDQAGRLVASVAQEGLIRLHDSS